MFRIISNTSYGKVEKELNEIAEKYEIIDVQYRTNTTTNVGTMHSVLVQYRGIKHE